MKAQTKDTTGNTMMEIHFSGFLVWHASEVVKWNC